MKEFSSYSTKNYVSFFCDLYYGHIVVISAIRKLKQFLVVSSVFMDHKMFIFSRLGLV